MSTIRVKLFQMVFIVICLLVPFHTSSTARAASSVGQGAGPQSANSPPETEAILENLSDLKWTPMVPQMDKNSPIIAIVHEHPQTHTRQFLIRMPPNFHVPAHFHSANETHTVIEGAFIMEVNNKKVTLKPGGFNYTPARMVHEAWTPADQGALIFVTIDGPYDLLQK